MRGSSRAGVERPNRNDAHISHIDARRRQSGPVTERLPAANSTPPLAPPRFTSGRCPLMKFDDVMVWVAHEKSLRMRSKADGLAAENDTRPFESSLGHREVWAQQGNVGIRTPQRRSRRGNRAHGCRAACSRRRSAGCRRRTASDINRAMPSAARTRQARHFANGKLVRAAANHFPVTMLIQARVLLSTRHSPLSAITTER